MGAKGAVKFRGSARSRQNSWGLFVPPPHSVCFKIMIRVDPDTEYRRGWTGGGTIRGWLLICLSGRFLPSARGRSRSRLMSVWADGVHRIE